MFTDRDGKYQLSALAESGFEPLARTCQFMLTEEAHHMFVGDTGNVPDLPNPIAQLMKEGEGAPTKLIKLTPPEHYYDGTRMHVHFQGGAGR